MDYSLLVGIHKLTPEEKAVIPLKLKGERKEKKGKGKEKKEKIDSKHFKKAVKNPNAKYVYLLRGFLAKKNQFSLKSFFRAKKTNFFTILNLLAFVT